MSTRANLPSRVLLLTIMLLTLSAWIPAGASAQGNAEAAHACQHGGWQSLVREDGTPFANQGDCVSYGARGGAIYPAAAVPCLAGGWATHARADSPMVAFASEADCIDFAMAGGEIVDLQTVVSAGVLTLEFFDNLIPGKTCSLTAELSNFPENTPLSVEFWVYEVNTGNTYKRGDTVDVTTGDDGTAKALGYYLEYRDDFPYEIQARASDGAESAWTPLDC